MSCIKLFFLSRRPFSFFFLLFLSAVLPTAVWPQAVSSQANIDASAQRRLQEATREAQRQRRLEEAIEKLPPALVPEKLVGSAGMVRIRQALGALVRLQSEGIPPKEALRRAIRSAKLDSDQASKPSAYLCKLLDENSGKITPAILTLLDQGQDPGPALSLSPYVP